MHNPDPIFARHKKWDTAQAQWMRKHPQCAVCGEIACKRNVHHKLPLTYLHAINRLDLELDERNLITLCVESDMQHHALVGHLNFYSSFNPWLMQTVAMCKGKTAKEIFDLAEFQQMVNNRPKPVHQMNAKELDELKQLTQRTFPCSPTQPS